MTLHASKLGNSACHCDFVKLIDDRRDQPSVPGMITRNMAILSRLSNVQRVVRSASVSVRQVTSVRITRDGVIIICDSGGSVR